MTKFKEIIIRKPKVYTLPRIELSGKWLDDIGFTVGTDVYVSYADSCLTLSINPNADIYENHSSVLIVESRLVRKRPRTTLVLDGFLLKRYGFNSGDRLGLTLSSNMIQISKINRFSILETS